MKRTLFTPGSRKAKWLLVSAFMLISVVALGLSNVRIAEAFGFCESCGQSCWNEANTGANNTAYWQCRDNGGSQSYCYQTVNLAYYNNCIAVDCNYAGCNLPPKND